MTRQIPPSYTRAVFQAVVYEVGNRKPSRDPSGWHQPNDHHRAIVSSLRLGPEVLIGSYTLCAMPIEMDGNEMHMHAACSAVIQFYPTVSNYLTMYMGNGQIRRHFGVFRETML